VKISIRRPNHSDYDSLHELFSDTINAAFKEQGLSNDFAGLYNEIEQKNRLVIEDLDSDGTARFFLVACAGDVIVGTISYGPCGKDIINCSKGVLKDVAEIGSVYVLPSYQGKGVGSLLLNAMLIVLIRNGVADFCLDSGYTRAQQFWRRKLGEPSIVAPDYWGVGSDHMVWHRKLEEMIIPVCASK